MESNLTLDQWQLEAEIGDSAGFGMGSRFGGRAWTDLQQRQITKALHSGLRMVYFTQELPGIAAGYDWSFFNITKSIVLPDGVTSLDMPSDFGGLNGRIIPASSTGDLEFLVAIVGRGELLSNRTRYSDMTGRPQSALIEPKKGTTRNQSNRYTLEIFPTPDADYTLQLDYYIHTDAPSEQLPHVYGGPMHAETFKAAVRAAYERYGLNIADGPEWMNFLERLRTSIKLDGRFKPMTLGPNLDRSDFESTAGIHDREYVPLTINGVASGYP